jgi:hypothetical protein
MRSLWLRTSSGIGLLFVALGVLLADRESDDYTREIASRS